MTEAPLAWPPRLPPGFVLVERRRRKAPRYAALLALVLLWGGAQWQTIAGHPESLIATVLRVPGLYAEAAGHRSLQAARECGIAGNFAAGRAGVMLGRYAGCD